MILSVIVFSCLQIPAVSQKANTYAFPEGYLREVGNVPPFWVATVDEVSEFLHKNIKKGRVEVIGRSAGGRPIMGVFYGQARNGKGTTTFSGSRGVRDIRAYRGPDYDKTVLFALSGVHGFELEPIMGMINLLSVFETGADLNGKEWPEIHAMPGSLDRIVVVPLVNPDGRARVPVRMGINRGGSPEAYLVHEYLNTGGNLDGTIIGWPDVKEFIPMDFSKFGFPGGYPNDAGVNIMHDDFFGKLQPETQAIFDLAEREKPDLVLNMHTGVPRNDFYMRMHRPFSEELLRPVFDSLYVQVHSGLAHEGLKGTKDLAREADPSKVNPSAYNFDTALNLHCGALSVVIESASHVYTGTNIYKEPVIHTPEMLLNAQLTAHREAMKFLLRTGGRANWEKPSK